MLSTMKPQDWDRGCGSSVPNSGEQRISIFSAQVFCLWNGSHCFLLHRQMKEVILCKIHGSTPDILGTDQVFSNTWLNSSIRTWQNAFYLHSQRTIVFCFCGYNTLDTEVAQVFIIRFSVCLQRHAWNVLLFKFLGLFVFSLYTYLIFISNSQCQNPYRCVSQMLCSL